MGNILIKSSGSTYLFIFLNSRASSSQGLASKTHNIISPILFFISFSCFFLQRDQIILAFNILLIVFPNIAKLVSVSLNLFFNPFRYSIDFAFFLIVKYIGAFKRNGNLLITQILYLSFKIKRFLNFMISSSSFVFP